MKPQPDTETDTQTDPSPVEQPEILDETEQFIEKLEAVERERKESEVEEAVEKVLEVEEKVLEAVEKVEEVEEKVLEAENALMEAEQKVEDEGDTPVVAAVEIIVQRPSIPSGPPETVETEKTEETEGIAETEETEGGEKTDGAVFEIVDTEVDTELMEEVKPAEDDTISIFAGVDADSTVIEGGAVASEFTLYQRDDDITGNYHVVEQGVIVSKRNEDNISVLSFSVDQDGDNVSLRSVTIEKEVSAAGDDVEEDDDDDDDAGSVKTLTEGEEGKRERVDVTDGVVYTNGVVEDDIEVHPDDQDDEVEVDQFKSGRQTEEEDRVSVRSYSVHGDFILSLHQRVQDPPAPQPRSRTQNNDNQNQTAEAEPEITEEIASKLEENLTYEDHRSRINFEAVVKASMEEHKAERKKTDVEVLEDIQREEGEDRPNIAMLLAWAKATRNKDTTQTFVVKKKKREEVLRQSVNNNLENFEVIIQEKVAQKVEKEEKPAFMVSKFQHDEICSNS